LALTVRPPGRGRYRHLGRTVHVRALAHVSAPGTGRPGADGVAGYPRDGANRWPAGHTLDVGHLYRLALEDAPAGTRWHAVGDEGIALREIAQSIGDHLGIPTASIPADRLEAHFGFLAMVIVLDNPTSNLATRRILRWEPTHPGLIADFDHGDYFATSSLGNGIHRTIAS
jgi:nucleoside-diphosphate-sugar epimerase